MCTFWENLNKSLRFVQFSSFNFSLLTTFKSSFTFLQNLRPIMIGILCSPKWQGHMCLLWNSQLKHMYLCSVGLFSNFRNKRMDIWFWSGNKKTAIISLWFFVVKYFEGKFRKNVWLVFREAFFACSFFASFLWATFEKFIFYNNILGGGSTVRLAIFRRKKQNFYVYR